MRWWISAPCGCCGHRKNHISGECKKLKQKISLQFSHNTEKTQKNHPSILGTRIRDDSFCDGMWQARTDDMSAHNCAAAAALAKNAFFCLCDFMRGTIDSCMAKKLPPIAAREISQPFAQDTCVTCHMHSLVNLLLGIGHHLSLKSQSVSFFFQFVN